MGQRILWVIVLGLALSGAAVAQTKTSGAVTCAKPDPSYSINVGDSAGHVLYLEKSACTWTKPMKIAGQSTKDGYSVSISDGSGTKIHANGYHVTNMSNGDKIFVRFYGQETTDRWYYIGGTGRFEGIKGKGTSQGKADASGNMVYEIVGEYTLPAKSTLPTKKK